EDDAGRREANRRRVWPLALLIVLGVIASILTEPLLEHSLQHRDVVLCRTPRRVERLDLGPQKVIGTACSQVSETQGVGRVDELQHLLPHLDRCNLTLLLAHATA